MSTNILNELAANSTDGIVFKNTSLSPLVSEPGLDTFCEEFVFKILNSITPSHHSPPGLAEQPTQHQTLVQDSSRVTDSYSYHGDTFPAAPDVSQKSALDELSIQDGSCEVDPSTN